MAISTATLKDMRRHLTDLHNTERSRYGVKRKLTENSTLDSIAQGYATQMASLNWSITAHGHTRPNGQCFALWWNSKAPAAWAGCQSCNGPCKRAIGENLAAGYNTNASVVAAWMNSPAHRANIINGNFANVGFGVADSKTNVRYWVAHFLN